MCKKKKSRGEGTTTAPFYPVHSAAPVVKNGENKKALLYDGNIIE